MSNRATAEILKGCKISVLDKGWIMLADVMGSDATICDRARGTTGGTRKVSSDRDLIRIMMRHHHGSSFEFPEIDVQICTTFVVWRQMIRHRAGNILDEMTCWDEPSVNELSGRYSEVPDIVQETPPDGWRTQSKTNRQGSGEFFPPEQGELFSLYEREATDEAMEAYRRLIASGVAKEQARKVWPMGGYTIGNMKMDLRNWLHWLALRLAPDAQKEIREYAQVMWREIVRPLFPITAEAFTDYQMESVTLTRLDAEALRRLVCGATGDAIWPDEWRGKARCRERDECAAKLARLGFTP